MKTREELEQLALQQLGTYDPPGPITHVDCATFAFEQIEAYKAVVMDAIATVSEEAWKYGDGGIDSTVIRRALSAVKEAITKQ